MIRLAVRVPRESAEIVLAELLELAPAGVEEIELASGLIEYAVYGAPGELPSLPDLSALGGDVLVEVSTSEVPDGWEERWKEFHRPVTLSPPAATERGSSRPIVDSGCQPPAIRIRPPWHEPAAGEHSDQLEIEIDPGRAFGTGAHPTTQLCIELLLELLAEGAPRGPFLDVGTGSGVIAIAARKLGFSPVLALDNDPASIEAASANALANYAPIEVRRFDLRREALPAMRDDGGGQGPLVCANLLLPLLLELASSLRSASHDSPPARLIVGGLLSSETDVASRAFAEGIGMVERSRRVRRDWAALSLCAPAQRSAGSSVAARTIAR